MQVVATWAPEDGILGAVAPLGLANARPTCLVVDLDPAGPQYPGELSLADLVERGPTKAELSPVRSGVCVMKNGGAGVVESIEVIHAMSLSWPHVVVRLPAAGLDVPWQSVKVRPLLPGNLFGRLEQHTVYQRSYWPVPAPDRSIVLPVPRPAVVAALLAGNRVRRSPWVKAWGPVWDDSWG